MEETKSKQPTENTKTETKSTETAKPERTSERIKVREGSGYLKQLYSTARTTAGTTHSHLKNLTTFLVNFVPVEKVDASELQVRTHFEESEITALAYSVKEHGVLQPILVVQDGDRYKVIAGERRLRAAKLAGLDRIPARVLSTNDRATHEIALRENLDRVDLHPLEEGEGYLSLLEAQLYTSHEAIAKAFGKPKSRITECIGFTRLPEATKQGLLSRGVRNRALLRQLLISPAETHLEMIAKAMGKEEVLSDGTPSANAQVTSSAEAPSALPIPPPKPVKPFTYKINSRSIAVPSFRWKKKEDPSILKNYIETLKKLLNEIEPLI